MPVTHCVCKEISFDHLLETSRELGLDFDQLCDRTKCTTACGMCEPYIRLMLKTGQTSFKPMSRVTINRVLAQAAESAGV